MRYTVDALRPKLDEFLLPLLEHAGFDLSYDVSAPENAHPEVENPEIAVKFEGRDLEFLLNNRAELLLALEHLAMEALRLPAEDHSLIAFDANDYRALRIEELRMSALAAAEKVKRTGVPFHFNPMTSRERRIIHLALRDEKELRSESIGLGPARAVVIVPAGMQTPPAPPPPMRGPQRGDRGNAFRGGNGRRDHDRSRERAPGRGMHRRPRDGRTHDSR